MLGPMLLSLINITYYQELMAGMRAAIAARQFDAFRNDVTAGWQRGDLALL